MSFSGFVFDMIRRDKENRDLRNLRRERFSQRQDKMHSGGHSGMPLNTTAEDMEKMKKQTVDREQSEQRYSTKMTLTILCICISIVSFFVFIFIS